MNLRVLGGAYKNRAISFDKKKTKIRPTLVRARQVVFDTLLNRLQHDFSFLDCFAGSGAMGIEALSRQASRVVFFDIDPVVVKSINENLTKMEKIPGEYFVIKTSAFRPPEGQPVDIIFLDPPYDKSFIIPKVLQKLHNANWIRPGTYVITENYIKDHIQLTDNYQLFKESAISNSILKFYLYQN